MVLKGFERTFTSGIRSRNELSHVGAGQLAVIIKGVLKDSYDGLLEGDNLGLQLIF